MADGPRAVVLAAGRGTRMRSTLPKVLHPLAGRPLLRHVVDLATEVTGRPPVVIVGPDQAEVEAALGGGAEVAVQAEARGTGDALRSVPARLRDPGPVVVLSGDVPLLRPATLRALLARHLAAAPACTLLTVVPPDPRGYGRIERSLDGRVSGIVEERDLVPGAPVPVECNAGVYVFEGERLWEALEWIGTGNAQGEYYLTDVVGLLGGSVETVQVDDPTEVIGVNDRRQLAAAEAEMRRRTLDSLMLGGVTVEDPDTTYVDAGVRIGADSVLLPMTVVRGETVLGEGCVVGPMAQLRDVVAGDRVRIGSSLLEECRLGDDVVVGAFNRVRPGSVLADGVVLGTHAEVKNSSLGRRTHVSHFSCVLDSDVGEDVNVGAGTVTCNFDGERKHRTVIGDRVFVGTDSILVAPVTLGSGAYTAAGSVITRDVPPGALAVERVEQRTVEGWADRRGRTGRAEEEPA